MKEKIRIVLADDHAIVRDGVKYLLEDEKDLEVVGEAANGKEALQLVDKYEPDLLIIDVRMPEMNGIDAVSILNQKPTKTKAIVLSMHDSEEYILKSIEAKAMGYLLKDASKEEVLKAIHTVGNGGKYFSGDISTVIVNNLLKKSSPIVSADVLSDTSAVTTDEFHLTKKEIEILRLILLGKTNKEISLELDKSKRTIETHRFNLMKKMNVKNLIELSVKASKLGLN
ncbi:response regulator transcription factor [Aureibaculum algae]|uniref:Response regulator transcription factor n=1 Tax=Aureibaculum algae TaxID=2584122 RepID=A0A5B7TUQ1_9FLAO|nr:response regulator transcription factor [Aureibaculum algae]QCX40565.1 response regulator transcription factor [Aureibaculum algae]